MKNIYGETVRLTKAQEREYKNLLIYGPFNVSIFEKRGQLHKTMMCLVEKGLVKVTYAWGTATRFERWM